MNSCLLKPKRRAIVTPRRSLAMSQQLLDRIAAAKGALENTAPENLIAQSRIQCNAVVEQLQRERLSLERKADLARLIEEVPH